MLRSGCLSEPDQPSNPVTQEPTVSINIQNSSIDGLFKKFHWNQSNYNEDKGAKLLQQMQSDEYNAHCKESANIYFPLNEKKEWQLVEWLRRSSLSQASTKTCDWKMLLYLE